MCYFRRMPRGAVLLACGVVMAVAISVANAGPVGLPAHDASASNLVSNDRSNTPSLDVLAGIEPSGLPALAPNQSSSQNPTQPFSIPTSSDFATPHATVIPLPPAIWTGSATLGCIVIAGAVRKFIRIMR